MTYQSYAIVASSLRQTIEAVFAGLMRRLRSLGHGKRYIQRRDVASTAHLRERHFGSLDDQLLSDIGLQRSEIRAAEYGILPGDQALHCDGAKRSIADDRLKAHGRT